MKKRMLAILLLALLVVNISSCNSDSQSETKEPFENVGTTGAKFEGTDEKITESEVDAETLEGEYDPVTNMNYILNDDGKSYSVCPGWLPDVVKELVFPVEYKGLPVTKLYGKCLLSEISIETIIIPEGIKEILISFEYCLNIKNIYIPASVVYIEGNICSSRPTMGMPAFVRSNVIEKIVVAEGNPYYYVDGNCLIERSSKKIILGCNNSVIPDDGSVKIIGKDAFANCKSLETIILPNSITELEYSAFINCPNLKQVYITSSASEDKKIVNFDTETVFGYDSGHTIYVPDAESLEIYSKVFGPYTKFEIGKP